MRNIINLNSDWTFTKEGKTEKVNLPHTWNAVDGQTGPQSYYRGTCVYEKKFSRPIMTDDECCYIQFDGVNSSCEVYLNNKLCLSHEGGYSTFRANITDLLEDENILSVKVDNSPNDRVYPQRADFTFYGGIYRDVKLITVNENHFDLDYYGGNGLEITTDINGKNAKVCVTAYYVGDADEVVISVDGVCETSLKAENGVAKGEIEIENVHLWDGLNDPYLYAVTATLIKNSKPVDRIYDKFGVREFHIDSEKGFFLNGKPYPLHGVSRHQDRLGVGNALTKEMHEEDIELILSVGANAIRLAHYQHDQYFLNLCDEKGIVTWAEIPYITVHMPNGRENTISQMKELIVQNFNHPSIFCWGLSNEISLQGVTDDLIENHKILNDLAHKMDPSRLTAMANLFMLETDSPLVTLPDITAYNLYYGWYVGEMGDNDKFFDDFHEKYPNVAVGLTEYGADSNVKLQSPKPEKGDFTESYQALYHEHMLEMFSTRPWIWGTFVWNMFEFAAAGRNEAGDPGKNHKGLITFDRKIKKDAYYIYKAWWSKEPFVHICGKRYHDRIEPVTEVKVYSNQNNLTLYVDGKELETKTGEHVFKFNVPINSVHKLVVKSGDLIDEAEIKKVDEPNPDYFISAEKVKNWFDEPKANGNVSDEYFSLASTMGEIQSVPEGKALLDNMMKHMGSSVAGGMGKGVKIPEAMLAMIARQPLSKLLTQAGIEIDSDTAKMLEASLQKIKKPKV
jgi:beta-galactosidase